MGYRVVVMLNNDMSSDWGSDPELGQKIARAARLKFLHPWDITRHNNVGNYGKVVEVTHANTETLATLTFYNGFKAVGYSFYRKEDTDEARNLRLLKDMAKNMGYRVSKIREKPVVALSEEEEPVVAQEKPAILLSEEELAQIRDDLKSEIMAIVTRNQIQKREIK